VQGYCGGPGCLTTTFDYVHWDGKSWTTQSTGVNTNSFEAIWGSGSNDVWIGATHWNASSWTSVPVPSGIRFAEEAGMWGSNPNDVWVAGAEDNGPRWQNAALHWTGAWSTVPLGDTGSNTAGNAFSSIWGSGANDVWMGSTSVTDSQGVGLQHWTGSAWSYMPLVPPSGSAAPSIVSIWGSGPQDVWAAGTDNAMVGWLQHWDGSAWSPVPITIGANGNKAGIGIWGSGPCDVWLVGKGIWHHP
jgi:hypothetical protein